MHHLTLKKAVATYQELPQEEQKAAIAADPKGFSEEEVNEILEAIKAGDKPVTEPKEPKTPKAGKHIVSAEFRDHSNFNKKWEVGADVSHFDKERLKRLVDLDLVKVL